MRWWEGQTRYQQQRSGRKSELPCYDTGNCLHRETQSVCQQAEGVVSPTGTGPEKLLVGKSGVRPIFGVMSIVVIYNIFNKLSYEGKTDLVLNTLCSRRLNLWIALWRRSATTPLDAKNFVPRCHH